MLAKIVHMDIRRINSAGEKRQPVSGVTGGTAFFELRLSDLRSDPGAAGIGFPENRRGETRK